MDDLSSQRAEGSGAGAGATIRRMLDLSTAHLPEHLGSKPGLAAHRAIIADARACGWLLWVPDDPDVDAAEAGGVPEEVLVVQRYARRLGCDYVLFDADGPVNPELPAWEW